MTPIASVPLKAPLSSGYKIARTITPVEQAAEEIWNGIERDKVHILIGKTARRLAFAARWMPGALRKQMRRGAMR